MYIKYPRTFHVSWSQGKSSDDKTLESVDQFVGKEVVVTSKIDGENTSAYRDHIHARSLDTGNHPSRNWIRAFHATFAHEIPEGFRICGENVFAFHSIYYRNLPSYFLVFGIYDNNNFCLSWDDTVEFCELLGLSTVPVIYRGIWDEKKVKAAWNGKDEYETYASLVPEPKKFPDDFTPTSAEGYVIRLADKFHYNDFARSTAKMVRENHVQTDQNWLDKPVFPNHLKEKA